MDVLSWVNLPIATQSLFVGPDETDPDTTHYRVQGSYKMPFMNVAIAKVNADTHAAITTHCDWTSPHNAFQASRRIIRVTYRLVCLDPKIALAAFLAALGPAFATTDLDFENVQVDPWLR